MGHPDPQMLAQLENHWKEIISAAPDGVLFGYRAILREGMPGPMSEVVDKSAFPRLIANFLGGLWPEKPLGFVVFAISSDGSAKPVASFGDMGGIWTPPGEIATNLKKSLDKP